jgi:SAM-dependent methyltransferase
MPWFADADLWADFQEPLFGTAGADQSRRDVDGACRLLELEPGARVLDLCCGPGRHSLELAGRGYRVTGVDLNGAYVDSARTLAGDHRLEAEFVKADAREFVRPGSFDAVINMFTSFGYFDDLSDDLVVLENVRRSLVPGGRLLVETTGKEVVARRGDRRSWFRIGGDRSEDLALYEESIADAYTRLELRWMRVRADGQRSHKRLSIRLYSAVELGSLLREAGFVDTTIYGNLGGAPYDTKATALVAVSRVPR